MTPARPRRSEAGTTLVEVLITVMILGVAFVALLGGFGTSIVSSDVHRRQAVAETLVRRYAESVKADRCWPTCPGTYAAGFAVPSGFEAPPATVVCYASDNVAVVPCPAAGIQRVTVRVRTTDGRVDTSVDLVKRPG